MQTYERTLKTPEEYADGFSARGYRFQSKELRDTVAKILTTRGIAFRKSSIRSQQIHPEYVADYEGTIETGFGNTMYQTYFKVLYTLE